MTRFLHTEADLQAGLAQLILADPRLAAVADKAGAFSLRRREAGFAGLCAIVCGQQLSTASAAAIRGRLFAAFVPFGHELVRKARTDKLKRLGLSAPKIKAIREIAKAVAEGQIDLEAVGNMEADAAHAALTALHDAGFFGLSWPVRFGGHDLPPVFDVILDEEITAAGAPPRPSLGYLVQGISTHGSKTSR